MSIQRHARRSRLHGHKLFLNISVAVVFCGFLVAIVAWSVWPDSPHSLSVASGGIPLPPSPMGHSNSRGEESGTKNPPDTQNLTASQNPSDTRQSGDQTLSADYGETCDGQAITTPNIDAIRAAVNRVETTIGPVSVSWMNPQKGVETVGALKNYSAWSTSKVPLAVAAAENNPGSTRHTITAAITASDNGAAEILWRTLGGNDQVRAQALGDILRQTGDSTTSVPTQRTHPPFSIFGQMEWSTASQVVFLAKLPCLRGAVPVVRDMGAVIPAQRWGIGQVPGAYFKGGWGPETNGKYTVRQMGWYPAPNSQRVLIAVSVQTTSEGASQAGLNILTNAATAPTAPAKQ